jgi:hypothetical protein
MGATTATTTTVMDEDSTQEYYQDDSVMDNLNNTNMDKEEETKTLDPDDDYLSLIANRKKSMTDTLEVLTRLRPWFLEANPTMKVFAKPRIWLNRREMELQATVDLQEF